MPLRIPLPPGYWGAYWKSLLFMLAGFAALAYVIHGRFDDVNWSPLFICGIYAVSFLLHLVFWLASSAWRESSKYQAGRGAVAYMPRLGPLVSLIMAPAFLFMPLLAALAILFETISTHGTSKEVNFPVVHQTNDSRDLAYRFVEVTDASGLLNFRVQVPANSALEGANLLRGEVLTGLFGNLYLRGLSRPSQP